MLKDHTKTCSGRENERKHKKVMTSSIKGKVVKSDVIADFSSVLSENS